MSVVIVTGSAGLVGSESVSFLADKFDTIIGIDNNLRQYFFGESGSTDWNRKRIENLVPNYKHYDVDIREMEALTKIFLEYGSSIRLIVHAAAQPSHDWAVREPLTDFSINATGTLNMLELTRQCCPDAVFIFTSTNKVYGDTPNYLPLVEKHSRWELDSSHPYFAKGIDENMNIDQSKHSLFGASKLSADIMVQEYGKYFGMKTGIFRGGCLTGPNHSGAQLHGFLAYLMKCTITGEPYTIYGYKGKQVRDNIHSFDLVNMFWHFYLNPKSGEVYNAGGGRFANCSILEAMQLCEEITGNKTNYSYSDTNRKGDHIWYISDCSKFEQQYPEWNQQYNLTDTLKEMFTGLKIRMA